MGLELVEKLESAGKNREIKIDMDSDVSPEQQLENQKDVIEDAVRASLIDEILQTRRNVGRVYPDPHFVYAENDQQYAVAEEAAEIGRDLVRRFHRLLDDADVRIDYVFIKNTPVKGGRETLGRAKKVSGLNAWLAMDQNERKNYPQPKQFFVIKLSWECWRRLPPAKQIALVDHELMHCTMKGDDLKPSLKPHDLEEFNAIVGRHGLWSNDITDFLKAARAAENQPLFK